MQLGVRQRTRAGWGGTEWAGAVLGGLAHSEVGWGTLGWARALWGGLDHPCAVGWRGPECAGVVPSSLARSMGAPVRTARGARFTVTPFCAQTGHFVPKTCLEDGKER